MQILFTHFLPLHSAILRFASYNSVTLHPARSFRLAFPVCVYKSPGIQQYSLNHIHYVHHLIRSFLTHYVSSLRFVHSFHTAVMALQKKNTVIQNLNRYNPPFVMILATPNYRDIKKHALSCLPILKVKSTSP